MEVKGPQQSPLDSEREEIWAQTSHLASLSSVLSFAGPQLWGCRSQDLSLAAGVHL